jgi:hypothetical protein
MPAPISPPKSCHHGDQRKERSTTADQRRRQHPRFEEDTPPAKATRRRNTRPRHHGRPGALPPCATPLQPFHPHATTTGQGKGVAPHHRTIGMQQTSVFYWGRSSFHRPPLHPAHTMEHHEEERERQRLQIRPTRSGSFLPVAEGHELLGLSPPTTMYKERRRRHPSAHLGR